MSRLFHRLEDVDVGDRFHLPLPLGPDSLLHGTLNNGLTYYVRPCSKPKGRAAIALVVKVGSVVEEDHEQGVAHMVEHLAFNATEQFSNHEIVRFLETIGAEFGACQNAYTTADETCYTLLIPTEGEGGEGLDPNVQLLQRALTVMAQFAFCIRCADEDVARERGAVLEEWRMSRNASGRAEEAYWRLMMQGSRYADRLPIGKESIIRTVPAATVKAFYERWYRPEHMAVVVVGDVPDPQAVVSLITSAFGSGRSRDPSPCPPIPEYHFTPHTEPRFQVFVDREAQSSSTTVTFKHARPRLSSPADYLKDMENWVFERVLSTRLFKLSHEQDPALLSGDVSQESVSRTTAAYGLAASALEGGTLRALRALLEEVARIRLHGISQREFTHALLDAKKDIENTYRERDQAYCWDIRDEYVRNFLSGEFVTGQEYEARLSKTLLGRVTKEAVEAIAQHYRADNSCVIKVVGHRKGLTEQDLSDVVRDVQQREAQGAITPWPADDVLAEELLPSSLPPALPQDAAIVAERKYELLRATEWRLSNGLTVLLKQTDFLEDQLLMSGLAVGGLSEVPRELHYTAACAPAVVNQLGKFGIKPTRLNDLLAGTHVDMSTSEGAYSRSFAAELSPEDLEVALQLLHRLFTTQVQVDEAELRVVLHMLHDSVRAQQRNPLTHFHNRVRAVNYGNCYYFRPMTHEDVQRVDLHKACEHHNRSYHNPAEYKIVFTGNIQVEGFMQLVLKYLATLPKCSQPVPKALREVTPLEWSPPAAPVVEDVPVRMVSPITQAELTFPVRLSKERGREDIVWLEMICRVLETRLLQRLRFKYGEIYTVSVTTFFGCESPGGQGDPRGDVAIAFTCDPANRHNLVEMALQEVEVLQSGGATQQELDTVVNLDRLQQAELEEENSYWHDVMVTGYQSRSFAATGDLDEVHRRLLNARVKVFKEISPTTLQEALCRMFPCPCRSRYTALYMVPRRNRVLGWAQDLLQLVTKRGSCSSSNDNSTASRRGMQRWQVMGLSAAAVLLAGAGVLWLSSRSSSSSKQSASSGGTKGIAGGR